MDFVKQNLKEGYEDSKKDRDRFMTQEESMQYGTATLAMLGIAIVISWLPFIDFSQIMLFLILTEIIAIKDTLRKSLTRKSS